MEYCDISKLNQAGPRVTQGEVPGFPKPNWSQTGPTGPCAAL